MKLVDVYADELSSMLHLWSLLAEREPHQSISHSKMPSVRRHIEFVRSRPYQAWYLIVNGDDVLGACYLTNRFEIGISVYRDHRGCGYGRRAVEMLMNRHGDGHYLANINPENATSIAMFDKIGFEPCQVTVAMKWPNIGPQ